MGATAIGAGVVASTRESHGENSAAPLQAGSWAMAGGTAAVGVGAAGQLGSIARGMSRADGVATHAAATQGSKLIGAGGAAFALGLVAVLGGAAGIALAKAHQGRSAATP